MEGRESITCRECGRAEELHWAQKHNELLKQKQLCFTCDFWDCYVAQKDDPKIARVAGRHYYVNQKTGFSRWNGFGGSLFKVRWLDGREAESNDVWSQGEIPAHFRGRLPDNAEFFK